MLFFAFYRFIWCTALSSIRVVLNVLYKEITYLLTKATQKMLNRAAFQVSGFQ